MSDEKTRAQQQFELEFEAFLRNDEAQLAALYRKLPLAAPDAQLDARVRALAQRELALSDDGHTSGAKADVEDANLTPTRMYLRHPRWLPALGAAAMLVLAAGIAWRMAPSAWTSRERTNAPVTAAVRAEEKAKLDSGANADKVANAVRESSAPKPPALSAPPTAPVRLPGPRLLGQRLDARTRERAEREPVEAYPQAGRHVAHRVERLVVGDDLEQVTRPRLREPDASVDRDAEIAPVAHADRRRAVHEVRAALGEEARRVVVHHPPVADRDQVRRAHHAIDVEMGEHARDVVGPARVLDVEEDPAPHRRTRPLGLGRQHARREKRLRVGGRYGLHQRGLGRRWRGGLFEREVEWRFGRPPASAAAAPPGGLPSCGHGTHHSKRG